MRRLFLALVAAVVMGCSTTGVSTAEPAATGTPQPIATAEATATLTPASTPKTTAKPTPTRTVEGPIAVTGNTKTGASSSFKLAGGSYDVAWRTTADSAGCDFYLFLATKINGPTVKDVPTAIMPEAQEYSGSTEWTGVPAGTYVLQEDRSGLLNCTGPWSATLTSR
jgi:hypothetical protein